MTLESWKRTVAGEAFKNAVKKSAKEMLNADRQRTLEAGVTSLKVTSGLNWAFDPSTGFAESACLYNQESADDLVVLLNENFETSVFCSIAIGHGNKRVFIGSYDLIELEKSGKLSLADHSTLSRQVRKLLDSKREEAQFKEVVEMAELLTETTPGLTWESDGYCITTLAELENQKAIGELQDVLNETFQTNVFSNVNQGIFIHYEAFKSLNPSDKNLLSLPQKIADVISRHMPENVPAIVRKMSVASGVGASPSPS